MLCDVVWMVFICGLYVLFLLFLLFFFFFKQKTAYEMRISDWSSDVCSSDLRAPDRPRWRNLVLRFRSDPTGADMITDSIQRYGSVTRFLHWGMAVLVATQFLKFGDRLGEGEHWIGQTIVPWHIRSEEHTSELQSLMRISYAFFFFKKKHNTYLFSIIF